jgi:hypothetical protein
MSEVIYNDPVLKEAAFALAEATPRHLDQPTTPPIRWREDAGLLRVLLADGRTVRGPLKYTPFPKPKAPELMVLPTHPVILSVNPPANLKPNGKKKAIPRPK